MLPITKSFVLKNSLRELGEIFKIYNRIFIEEVNDELI